MGSFIFASPFVLLAFFALPAIWWLLKLIPPRPKREVFPPLYILLKLTKRDETPAKSPWWLTLLRMLLASLVILAIANPVLNPRRTTIVNDKPLALLIDNGWASAEDWNARTNAARALIDRADSADQPVSIVFTASGVHDATLVSASEARQLLAAAKPRPLTTTRRGAAEALSNAFINQAPGTIAFITDNLDNPDDTAAFEILNGTGADDMLVLRSHTHAPVALTGVSNNVAETKISAIRSETGEIANLTVDAYDLQGHVIASAPLVFAASENATTTEIKAPFEVRNDFARLSINGKPNAGAIQLLDDGFKRRRVAIASGAATNEAQPLLSPTYYLKQALRPYADLTESNTGYLPEDLKKLLEQNPSVLILSDVGALPEETNAAITQWVEKGGTLVRFAGTRLAASPADDRLLPVALRSGARAFGGAMSWSVPQKLAPFAPDSPFYGLPTPDDITIMRQVLAEPAPTLSDHTWASLTDGTPLVTEGALGEGRIILFHTSADANWSNLPISGYFVEMLRRIVNLSRASQVTQGEENSTEFLSPYRLLTENGVLSSNISGAKPLAENGGNTLTASLENPPGLYGSADGFTALNLFNSSYTLSPLDISMLGSTLRVQPLNARKSLSIKPYLLAASIILLIVDGIIILIMNGALSALKTRRSSLPLILVAMLTVMPLLMVSVVPSSAKMNDAEVADLLYETHLAYVITGDNAVDRVSNRGLKGLSNYISYSTALEPGDPIGIDPASDELAFYPLIYWPMVSSAPFPSEEAIANVAAYMRNGGTVVFDTRDQYSALGQGSISPNTRRLRMILDNIDVPPLEPVPEGHVLTRSFYLLSDFPGRYDGSPLWVEARTSENNGDIITSGGDGVSPIIITGNDMAGAWAINADSTPMLPTIPEDPRQREMAYRAGTNIIMYMLTGNYKADQVHLPALLERLGQ